MENKEIIVSNNQIIIPDDKQVSEGMNKLKVFQKIVKQQLKEGEDYGLIPNTPKPSLWKSGAEKLLSILGLSTRIKEAKEIDKTIKLHGKEIPYFEFKFIVQAIDKNGNVRGEGVGSCNSLEKKFCTVRKQVVLDPIHYYDKKNTLEKMAMKRAIVDLALRVGALSNVFTQDLEDMDKEAINHNNQASYQASYRASNQSNNSQTKSDLISPAQLEYIKNLLSQIPDEMLKKAELNLTDNVLERLTKKEASNMINDLKQVIATINQNKQNKSAEPEKFIEFD